MELLGVRRRVQFVIQSKAPGLLGEKSAADDGSEAEQMCVAYWALFYHPEDICQWLCVKMA